MVFAEALGEEAFRERVKIYATDVDEEALVAGAHGRLPGEGARRRPAEARERYFEESGAQLHLPPDLRRAVIFGRHDLTRTRRSRGSTCSSAATRSCTSTPRRRPRSAPAALRAKPGGYLFLGRAEMLLRTPSCSSRSTSSAGSSARSPRSAGTSTGIGDRRADRRGPPSGRRRAAAQTIADAAPIAQIVVDAHGRSRSSTTRRAPAVRAL